MRHNNIARQNLLSSLMEDYGTKLKHLCMVYYPYDRHRRDELFNDIVYRLWRSLGHFDPEGDPWPWIVRVAYNAAMSMHRRTRLSRLTRTITPADDRIAEEDAGRDTMLAELYRLIDKLDTRDRTLTYLYIDNLPQARIAQIMQTSETNVSTRINRIKEKLKKMHDNGEGDI